MLTARATKLFASCLLAASLSACSAGYYWQASMGQMRLVFGKDAVADVLQETGLAPDVRAKLELSQAALSFAHTELLLPDNGSYRSYYDTGKPFVVWNVFAAPELSLQPRTWCFPVTGCIAYRGYFNEQKARNYAAKLAARGDDVSVGGVPAYSTLGRFRDPVLNTMLRRTDLDFVGLLFHELAHQLVYVQDDSAFNEGFATAVANEGLRRWITARNIQADDVDQAVHEQTRQVVNLLRAKRVELAALYSADLSIAAKRRGKQEIFSALRAEYEQLSRGWVNAGYRARPYGALFTGPLNNASLSAVGTYDDYVPAFELLLADCVWQLACFYQRVEELSELAVEPRTARIQELTTRSKPAGN